MFVLYKANFYNKVFFFYRCIASTPSHLDVKIRVARGLAGEGWTITKYLLVMITLVTISFFLFIPIVQEICIYGSVVLLCDLFMQLLFLPSVLSIDMQSIDGIQDASKKLGRHLYSSPINDSLDKDMDNVPPNHFIATQSLPNMSRSNLVHQRKSKQIRSSHGKDRLAPLSNSKNKSGVISKQLRITYFVTSKRLLQRMIICIFVSWIAWIIYTTCGLFDEDFDLHIEQHKGTLESLIHDIRNRSISNIHNLNLKDLPENVSINRASSKKVGETILEKELNVNGEASNNSTTDDPFVLDLLHKNDYLSSEHLFENHWQQLFGYYNMSLR